MRPYDSVDVRDVPIRRVRSVRGRATGRTLTYRAATVVAVELEGAP